MPKVATPARALDKFYTRPDVAAACARTALAAIGPFKGSVLYVDPCAGDGAFLDNLPEPRIGLDVSPGAGRPDIIRADYLDWRPSVHTDNVVVISNFPFGKNASLARRFLNHSATFATFVASILPRTFEKPGVRSKLHPNLHLTSETPLSSDSFLFEGEPYCVPVVFQVYEVSQRLRQDAPGQRTHADFEFVRDPTAADFAFQRVGARAGRVSGEGLRMSPQSHYFIKSRAQHADVRSILSSISWDEVKNRTAGNPSIGKAELVAAYRSARS